MARAFNARTFRARTFKARTFNGDPSSGAVSGEVRIRPAYKGKVRVTPRTFTV